ncbi:MAG: hypothetical protein ACR2MT_15270, partial [Aurantibacter sp.]
MSIAKIFPLIPLLFLSVSVVLAQDSLVIAKTTDRPVAKAVALETGPQIDGNVTNDEVWSAVEPFGDFTQTQPNFGRPA